MEISQRKRRILTAIVENYIATAEPVVATVVGEIAYRELLTLTDGIGIVDKICESAKPINSNGLIDTADRPVIKTITILD